MPVKIIAGLGNPGAQYANTPHSVGFEVVDAIATAIGAVWENKKAFSCLMAKGVLGGVHVLLVKPQTYMNLSGDSIAPIVKYNNATCEDLLVIQDDIDLPLGKIRIRKGGSCGGHNGIRNIIERIGASNFSRLKIGVGKDRSNVIGHVLGKFDPRSRTVMDQAVKVSVDAAESIIKLGAERAMNAFNNWSAKIDNINS